MPPPSSVREEEEELVTLESPGGGPYGSPAQLELRESESVMGDVQTRSRVGRTTAPIRWAIGEPGVSDGPDF
jgi:hypothetical protein